MTVLDGISYWDCALWELALVRVIWKGPAFSFVFLLLASRLLSFLPTEEAITVDEEEVDVGAYEAAKIDWNCILVDKTLFLSSSHSIFILTSFLNAVK